MTYNLINPTNHTQGNSQPLSLATASAPVPAPTITTTLPVGPPNTAPTTVHHPSSGAKEISHPPDPLASGLEDPAIVKISAHFTKPATKPSKLPSKSPYNYEPQTVTNSSNQKSTATAVRSTITYGCHTLFFPRILAAWLMSHGSLALNIAFSVLNIVQRPQHHFLAKMWHKNDVFDEKKRILIMYGRYPQ